MLEMFGFGKHKKDPEGISLLQKGQLDAALAHFTTRLQANTNDVDTMIQIAKVYFRKKEFIKAKEWLLNIVRGNLDEFQMSQILDMTNYKKIASENYFNSYPAFSPDGKWIAYSSARRDTSEDGRIRLNDRPGLYIANVENGTEIQIAPDDYYNSQSTFSLDGQRVAYLSARKDTNDDKRIDHTDDPSLYVKDLSSGKEECVVDCIHRPKFPSFSPDGRSLLFCAWYSRAPTCGIYLIDLQTKLIKPVQRLFESNFPIFSPKGDRILFSNWRTDTNKDGRIDIRDNSSIYEFNLKSGTEGIVVPDTYSNSYPNISPDGESIVYLSRRRDTNGDGEINSLDNSGIYVLNLNKKKEKLVVSDEHYNKFPTFSHDGKHVVFLGSWRAQKKKLLDEEGLEHSEYFDNKGIHCVDITGGEEREIVTTKFYGCRYLTISPRSSWVAYIAWRKDTNRGLYIAPIDRMVTPNELKDIIEKNL